MTDAAILAKGSILRMGDALAAETPTYAEVAELLSVPWPQRERTRIDTTTHDSPGESRQYIAGLSDLPAVDFEIFYLPNEATHDYSTGLGAMQQSGDIVGWQVVTQPDVIPSQTLTFDGYVNRFNVTAPVDNAYRAAVQLQPTSEPVVT